MSGLIRPNLSSCSAKTALYLKQPLRLLGRRCTRQRCEARASDKGPPSRRLLLGVLKASLTLGTAAGLETWARPPVLPSVTIPADQNSIQTAKAAFRNAQELAAQKQHEGAATMGLFSTTTETSAIGKYSEVIDGVPQEYTLCMRSLLGRRDSLLALGKNEAAGRDARQEWVWGRGIRWPGWYIIAAILIRNEIVD
ncbi:hypothetical protein WJX84_004533 [Apatococcus fuscideae]|uniref:Uncharacterized protein n=1 Tax=Apatococcus fuscideae TaxID=2026836 RepID=A0AAW1RHL6_9CHLO